MALWIGFKERQGALRRQLNWPKRFPTNSTYSEALAHCDAQPIVTTIAGVLLKARALKLQASQSSILQSQYREEVLTQVAMGGKTLRGTLKHERYQQPSVHLVSLYECQSGIVLTRASYAKHAKTRSVRRLWFTSALVEGRIMSTDVMQTHADAPRLRLCLRGV